MEKIIISALVGGYKIPGIELHNGQMFAFRKMESLTDLFYKCILDREFWKVLGSEAVGNWGNLYFHEDDGKTYWSYDMCCPQCREVMPDLEEGCESCNYEGDDGEVVSWLSKGIFFYEMILSQNLEKAVEWLETQIK